MRAAAVKLMRPSRQRISEVKGMAATACVRLLFIVNPECPVWISQHPGANRAEGAGYSFGILIEDVCQMVMLLIVVQIQHLVGMLYGLSDLTYPAVAITGKCVSRDQ